MKSILSRAGYRALARLMVRDPLLAFDFDGTLAPLVQDPDRARMRPTTRTLLARLAALRPCVVISGRSRAEVADRLRRVPLRMVVGNHGAEPGLGRRHRSTMDSWLPRIAAALAGLRGVRIEDKRLSLSIHVRPPASLRGVRAALATAIPTGSGPRITSGKRLLNLVDHTAPDKGEALARSMTRLGCNHALFVGDDTTDEHVFARHRGRHVVTVRVGRGRVSHARWRLFRQDQVDQLLRTLLQLAGTGDRASPASALQRRIRPSAAAERSGPGQRRAGIHGCRWR